ncbi:MAG TPA: protein kinase, partial [Burkholderiaceae bacterium]|nr:protein kinase [Burkholderiaceae bacterium]
MSTPPSSAIPPQLPSSAAPANVVVEHDALTIGTRFGEFEILRVVGVGGFGIVYLAQDHSLERQVALKEYMPAALAARGDGSRITVRSAAFAETYAIGLRSFVNEARLLARFDHPSLVKVYRFWEDNGTAYMVMPFLRGMTLRDARRSMERAPDEPWIRSVIDPLLGALELLHREGVFHRDIAPDNILLPPAGPPILLDFGAARHVISDRTQSLTAILKPSYAPIEQYAEMTSMRQGPWTDIYALGAVMHYLLFGVPPAPATARAVQPDAQPVAQREVPGVSANLLATVGWALGVRPAERPQSIAMLRDALNGVVPVPAAPQDAAAAAAAMSPVAPPLNPVAAPAPTSGFPATQRLVPPRASDPTRLDAAHEPVRTVPPAQDDAEATIVRPSTLPPVSLPPVSLPPFAKQPVAASAPVATPVTAAPASTVSSAASTPAAPKKKGWMLAGLGAAAVVAAVVLWQFVSL